MLEMPIVRSNLAQTAIVSFLLFAAITLLSSVLAYWTWAWLGPSAQPRAQFDTENSSRATSAKFLFGQNTQQVEAPAGPAIKLIGVISATGGKPGYALMQVDAKNILTVRVGDEIAPGVRLHEVLRGHVTIARAGGRETVALAERAKPSAILSGIRK